jgi:hypothetical protein
MNRLQTKQIADAAHVALETVAAEFGVEINYNGGSYTEGSCIIKFEFAEIREGVAMTRIAADFGRHAESFGLEASDLGREFMSNGQMFRIDGLNTRATKMPIAASAVKSGRSYKFGAETVKRALRIASLGSES